MTLCKVPTILLIALLVAIVCDLLIDFFFSVFRVCEFQSTITKKSHRKFLIKAMNESHLKKKNQHFRSQFFLMILTIKPGTSDSTLICCSYQFQILKRRRKGSLNSFSRCTNRFCVIIHDCSRLEKTSFLPQFRSSFIELDGQKKEGEKKNFPFRDLHFVLPRAIRTQK